MPFLIGVPFGSVFRTYKPFVEYIFRVTRLFPARFPVRCRGRDVLAGLFLFDRTDFELRTESGNC